MPALTDEETTTGVLHVFGIRRNPERGDAIVRRMIGGNNTAVDADGSEVQVFENWDTVPDRSRSTTTAAAETESALTFEAQLAVSEGELVMVVQEGAEGVALVRVRERL